MIGIGWVIFIVVILIFVWYATRGRRLRSSIKENINKSSGLMDQPARDALTDLNNINDPTVVDRYRRANLIRYNVLEGDVQRDHELARTVAAEYMMIMNQLPFANINDEDIEADAMARTIMEFALLPGAWERDQNIPVWNLQGINTQVNERTIESKLADAATTAPTRKLAVDKYMKSNKTYTNDAQNVHESKINASLRATLAMIRIDDVNPQKALDEAKEYSKKSKHHDKIVKILNKFSEQSHIHGLEDYEHKIFAYVWERSKHPNNKKNKTLMCDAIMDALADSVGTNDTPVCVHGRCARVIHSLAFLDFAEEAGQVMTYEAYKNQIFEESKDIIDIVLAKFAKGTHEQQDFVKAYNEGIDINENTEFSSTREPSDKEAPFDSSKETPNEKSRKDSLKETEKVFFQTVEQNVDDILHSYRDKLSADEIKTIRTGVLAFMGL